MPQASSILDAAKQLLKKKPEPIRDDERQCDECDEPKANHDEIDFNDV